MNPAVGRRIRPAGEADIPVVRSLAETIWWSSYPGILSDAQIRYMLEWMYSAERLAADLARGVRYGIAEVDGLPVGYVATEAASATDTLHLHKLYLLSSHQGLGLGQWLLGEVLALAVESGLRQVELRVNKGNLRALKAYERAGFRCREAVVADIGGGFVMDDFILVRPVGPADQNVK